MELNTKRMPDFGFGLLQLIPRSIFPLMTIDLVMFVGFSIWDFFTASVRKTRLPQYIRIDPSISIMAD